jgi:large subunit ribosomal protein L29
MKTQQMRELSDHDLEGQLKETIKNLFQMRCQSATEKLETPSQLKKARREIARIKTLQRQRELVVEAAQAAEAAKAAAAAKVPEPVKAPAPTKAPPPAKKPKTKASKEK